MIPIGRGAGAGTDTVDEMPWTYRIFRERADGPKWAACLREGRKLRERAATKRDAFGWPPAEVFVTDEPGGIPVGWWGRP